MRACFILMAVLIGLTSTTAKAQRTNARPQEDVLSSGALPDLNAFTATGKPIKLRELCAGKYTVLSAGCLTCPQFHQGYPEVEAMSADYASQGVQFFYFYKSLRHPELNGYVQAQNMTERLLQLEEARIKLGTKVPWIADTLDDSIRLGLQSGPNSLYLISPNGEILAASSRIEGNTLREALAKYVGPVKHPTNPGELDLPRVSRQAQAVNEDSKLGVERPAGMTILSITPAEPNETYYVKLRAEADSNLMRSGTGRLFLGFYPDPIHDAHWNNLTAPMKYILQLPAGVTATPSEASAAKGSGDSDTEPRQFWVDVKGAHTGDEIELTLHYFGCAPGVCMALTHKYTLRIEATNNGAITYGINRGARNSSKGSSKSEVKGQSQGGGDRFSKMDINCDGKITFTEMCAQQKSRDPDGFDSARIKRRFDQIDTNHNDSISKKELEAAPQPNGSRER
jgi:hypothetical protein